MPDPVIEEATEVCITAAEYQVNRKIFLSKGFSKSTNLFRADFQLEVFSF